MIWEKINTNFIEPVSLSQVKRNVCAYGSAIPLKIIGSFKTELRWRENCLKEVEFLIYDGEGTSLIGNRTATELGVLNILSDVNALEESEDILADYVDCFEGFGKLKNFQLKLPINSDIQPICRYPDNCPNGHDPEWTQSRMDTIPNGHNPEWTHNLEWKQSRMDTIPNGHNPEWTQSRMDTIPNGRNPE